MCADPYAIDLVCRKGHHFFIMPEPPLALESAKAASFSFPESERRSSEAIISCWLSNPAARAMLDEQLAMILRSIAQGRRVSGESQFSFCPLCGGELSEYEQENIYVQGLKCPSGHNWSLRGVYFCAATAGTKVGLHAEHCDSALCDLISTWLKAEPLLDRQLHETVRRVLSEYVCDRKEAR